MTKIFLIRHGEISPFTPRRFIGQTDVMLTDHGREQMFQLSEYLKSFPADRFVCSPLGRCLESCDILTAGSEYEIIKDFKEISLGEWDGLTVEEVKKRFPGSYENRGADMGYFRPEGGESFSDLQQRSWPVFDAIARGGDRLVVIVAHAGVNRVLLCRLLGMPLENLFRIEQQYGCLNVINYYDETYRLMSMNWCP